LSAVCSCARWLLTELEVVDFMRNFASEFICITWTQTANREHVGHRLTTLLSFLYLLLTFLEASEVVLDEESGIESADRDLVATWRWNNLVQQLSASSFPQLLNDCTQLLVSYVDVAYKIRSSLLKDVRREPSFACFNLKTKNPVTKTYSQKRGSILDLTKEIFPTQHLFFFSDNAKIPEVKWCREYVLNLMKCNHVRLNR